MSSSVYAIIRFAGWSFIPDYATRSILGILHRLSHRFPRLPSPTTPAYRTQYRYTYAFVVLTFLIYNLEEGARTTEPNFYQLLGVTPEAEQRTLKLAFRQFARKHHPDKISRYRTGEGSEDLFMVVRDAFEALKDPVVRFAYDRFGPDVLSWTDCKTMTEYLHHGLVQSSGYHIITGACLLLFSAIGRPSPVAFWRYILFASLLASELALLLSASPSAAGSSFTSPMAAFTCNLHILFPQRVAYQHVGILHELFIFLSIALSQVAPQLFLDETMDERTAIQRLESLAGVADREASIMLHTELHSIHPPSTSHTSLTHMKPYPSPPSEQVMQLLTEEMQNMIIETNVKKDTGPLKSAWEGAITRGRESSAVDADGNLEPPSPISPGGTPRQKPPVNAVTDSKDMDTLVSEPHWLQGQGKLPSPRPSPPPFLIPRRGLSHARARSVSY